MNQPVFKKIKLFVIPIILFMCLFYFLVNALLLSFSKTPTWGKVTYPEYVTSGKVIPISISYKEIIEPTHVFIRTVYQNKNKKYCGQKNYKQPVATIFGSGRKKFTLPFAVSDTVYRIRINIYLDEASLNNKSSIYSTRTFASPPRSSWIPVSHNGLPIEKHKPTFTYILSKGYSQGYWKDFRGDYTFIGWAITFIYALWICILLSYIYRTSFASRTDTVFWWTAFSIILFLAINKQMDLQMLITDIARTAAKEYQLYEIRKPFQIQFISLFATLGFGFITLIIFFINKAHKSLLLASVGISLLFSFLVIRLISHHKTETFFGQSLGYLNLFDVIEISGICVVCSSLLWYCKNHKLL